MLKYYHTVGGDLEVNTYYVVNEDTNEGLVIDAGVDGGAVLDFAKTNGFILRACLFTHGHFDHTLCAHTLQEAGVKIYISYIDAHMLETGDTLSKDFGLLSTPIKPDFTFTEGDELCICGINVKVMLTPGHTAGSCCFIIENKLFSGDTMFEASYGRTDFPTGSMMEMVKSINRLLDLENDYLVYPGHGNVTTIKNERTVYRKR